MTMLFLNAVSICVLIAMDGPTVQILAQNQAQRAVKNNTIISPALPNIRIRVNKAFTYAGKVDFKIRDVAQGERYIFIETQDKRITRLFIAQFEGFLPSNVLTYNYSFQNGIDLAGHRFKQNTFAFSNEEARSENPSGEAALTAAFLREKGFVLDDELMTSRLVNVPDQERRHELILFYVENVSSTGRRLQEFYNGDEETNVWKNVSKALTARAFKNFEIIK